MRQPPRVDVGSCSDDHGSCRQTNADNSSVRGGVERGLVNGVSDLTVMPSEYRIDDCSCIFGKLGFYELTSCNEFVIHVTGSSFGSLRWGMAVGGDIVRGWKKVRE